MNKKTQVKSVFIKAFIVVMIIALPLLFSIQGKADAIIPSDKLLFEDKIVNATSLIKAFNTTNTTNIENEIFVELKINDANLKEAVFMMNSTKLGAEDNLSIVFNEVCGKVKSYEILVNGICWKDVSTYEYINTTICYNLTIDNKTLEKEVVCYVEQEISKTIHTNTSYSCEKPFTNLVGVKDVHLKADISMSKCFDGTYGYKIDWKPSINLSGNILVDDKWAWWNSSYLYKLPINCSKVGDGVPVVINGSNGFSINGNRQIVWINCRNNTGLAVYYNNFSSYVVANDTAQVAFEVELGNVSSYNPSSVWDSYYLGVWHNKDNNSTSVLDSTNNNRTGTKKGANEPVEVDGKIHKAQDFDGTDDSINLNNVNMNPSPLTIEVWVRYNTTPADLDIIFGKQYNVPGYACYAIFYRSATTDMQFVTSSGTTEYWAKSGKYPLNTWAYVVGRYNGSMNSIYYNGTLMHNLSSSAQFSATYTAYIGSYLPGGFRSIADIDEVRLSNTSRSESYIWEVYNNIIGTNGFGNLLAEETPTPPIITINNPPDFNWTNDDTPSINFTATDDKNNSMRCDLTMNNTLYGFNASTLNNTATIITANTSLSFFNVYNYWINCTDGTNMNQSTSRTLYLYNCTVGACSAGCLTFSPGCYAMATTGCDYVTT